MPGQLRRALLLVALLHLPVGLVIFVGLILIERHDAWLGAALGVSSQMALFTLSLGCIVGVPLAAAAIWKLLSVRFPNLLPDDD